MFPGVPHIIAYMCWLRPNRVPYQVSDKEGRDSLVEVYKREEKSVISVVKRLKKADRSDTFYLCKKVDRTFCFCSLFIF